MNTEKKRSFIINFIYYLILAGIAVLVLKYALPMLAPFVLGFLIAYLMRKPTQFLASKTKISYKLAALITTLLFYATIGVLIALIILRAIAGVQSLIAIIPRFYERDVAPLLTSVLGNIEGTLLELNPDMFNFISGIDEQFLSSLGQLISTVSTRAVSAVSGIATAIPGLFIKLVLMIISSFFIAVDYDVLAGFCTRQLSESAAKLIDQIHEYIIGTLFVCIRSYVIIMSITFVELSIGLSIADVRHPVLIAALIAVFDILPVLGTGGIMIPWVVISALSGDFGLALALLLIYLAVTVIRNIIEPKIVGGQLGLHPIVTLVSMFAGLQLFGAIGLFGFPIVLSLLRHLNHNGTIRIFK